MLSSSVFATVLLLVGLFSTTVVAQAQAGRDAYTRGSVGFGCYAARPTSQDNSTPYYQTSNGASAQACSVRLPRTSLPIARAGHSQCSIRTDTTRTIAPSSDLRMPMPPSSTTGKAPLRHAGVETFTSARNSSRLATTLVTPVRAIHETYGRTAGSRPRSPPMVLSAGHARRPRRWRTVHSRRARRSGRSAV
jgi:hypothetical protein